MDDETGIILTSVLVTLGSGIVAGASAGKAPAFNQFLGAGFMGAFLFGVEMINGELAKLLAILVIIGVLLRNGDVLFGWVTKSTTKPAAVSKTPSQQHDHCNCEAGVSNDVFKVLGAVMALATLSVVLAKSSQTASVSSAFFTGFSQLLSAAGNAGNGTTKTGSPNA